MIVIGIVGLIGAGKDTLAKYIEEKYGYISISYSELVHEKVKEEGLEPTRENLQMIAKKYREKYGMDYFAKLAVEKANNLGYDKIILKELRRKEDVEYPKSVFKNFYIIEVFANKKLRFKRIKKRASIKDPKTWKEFLDQERKEKELGFHEALKYADFRISNNGNLKEFYNKIDEIMKKIDIIYKVEKAVEKYNLYRSPEAKASLLNNKINKVLRIKFEGTFCTTCGFHDYFEDFIVFLEEFGINGKINKIIEKNGFFIVEFKIRV